MPAKSTDVLDAATANFLLITRPSIALLTRDLDLRLIPPLDGYGSFMPG
jgi:hypothetical protein